MQKSPSIKNGEESLLSVCPWCEYALKGLPIEHVCPECGEAFDRRWRMYEYGESLPPAGAVRFWYRLMTFAIGCCCILYLLFDLICDSLGRDSLDYLPWKSVLSLFAIGVLNDFVSGIFREKSRYALVGPSGLVLRDRLQDRVHRIPWSQISTATRKRSCIMLELEDDIVTLASMRHADDCLEEIEKWRHLHQVP